MFVKLLLSVLTTEAAKTLVVYAADRLAKRTDNHLDDVAVAALARALRVTLPEAK